MNCALNILSQFVELMEETIKTPVCVLAEEIAKNTVKENVHRKRVVLDALVF